MSVAVRTRTISQRIPSGRSYLVVAVPRRRSRLHMRSSIPNAAGASYTVRGWLHAVQEDRVRECGRLEIDVDAAFELGNIHAVDGPPAGAVGLDHAEVLPAGDDLAHVGASVPFVMTD